MSDPKELTLFSDGASKGNPGPAGIGVVLLDENGDVVEECSRYIGVATNNQAEYKALILGLERAVANGATSLLLCLDSELVVRQLAGIYRVKNRDLMEAAKTAKDLLAQFEKIRIQHVPRSQNARANVLAQRGSRARPD